MKKKSFLPIIAIFVVLIISYYKLTEDKADKNWQTYTLENKKIRTYKTTKKEIKDVSLPVHKKVINTKKTKHLSPKRKIISYKNQIKNLNNLEMINTPDSNWEKKLASIFLSINPKETKVFVKKINGLVKVQNGKGRFLEQVKVTIKRPGLPRINFDAYVDSQTGMVVDKWNKSLFENSKHMEWVKKI